MRSFALTALLLGACAMPFKYQVYELKPQHADVLWVYRGGSLWRCWQDSGHPLCEQAVMRERASELSTPATGPKTASRTTGQPDSKHAADPPASIPRQPKDTTAGTDDPAAPQYPDYTK